MLNFKKASVIKNLVGKTEIVMRRHTKIKMGEMRKKQDEKTQSQKEKENVNEKEGDRDTMKVRVNAK